MNENAWGDSADLNRVTYSLSLIYPSIHKRSTFLGEKVIQKRSAASLDPLGTFLHRPLVAWRRIYRL